MRLLSSIAKRKADAYSGHIARGSSRKDMLTILEGRIDGIRSRGAQRRRWTDDVKDWQWRFYRGPRPPKNFLGPFVGPLLS